MEEKTTIEILGEIIEKYNIGPKGIFSDEKVLEMLRKVENEEEASSIIKNLPIVKLNEIIRKIEKKEIPIENLEKEIKIELKVNELKSLAMAREIKERIFKEREIKEIVPEEVKKEEVKKEDIYREPIE